MPRSVIVSGDTATKSSDQPSAIAEAKDLLPLFLLRYDRANTRRSYETDLVRFFGTDTITLIIAQQVTFVEVNAYLKGLEDDGLKPSTRRRRLAAVRMFYKWLIGLGVLVTNPCDSAVVRRIPSANINAARVVLTQKQAKRLVEAAGEDERTGVRDRAMIMTMIHTCLRRSEVAAMDTKHLRMLGAYWVVDLPNTKGGADQYVKIPAHVVEEIKAMRRHYQLPDGPIWVSLSNRNLFGRLHPDSVYRIVQRAADRAELAAEVGAHTLRHTGCTLALEAGASLQQVQTHARHKHLQTTMNYIHQRDKLKDSAADYIKL